MILSCVISQCNTVLSTLLECSFRRAITLHRSTKVQCCDGTCELLSTVALAGAGGHGHKLWHHIRFSDRDSHSTCANQQLREVEARVFEGNQPNPPSPSKILAVWAGFKANEMVLIPLTD